MDIYIYTYIYAYVYVYVYACIYIWVEPHRFKPSLLAWPMVEPGEKLLYISAGKHAYIVNYMCVVCVCVYIYVYKGGIKSN